MSLDGSHLQFTGFPQVFQHFDNVLGHGRRRGQMVALGLEAVLVGRPGGFDERAVRSYIREAAAGRHSGVVLAELLVAAALGHFDSVGALETLPVATILEGFDALFNNGHRWQLGGHGQGEEGAEYDLKTLKKITSHQGKLKRKIYYGYQFHF